MSKQDTLATSEIAELCGVTPRTVNRWINTGCFPGARKGPGRTSPYRVPREEVEAFKALISQGMEPQSQRAEPFVPVPPVRQANLAALQGQMERDLYALVVEDDTHGGRIFEFAMRSAGFNPVVARSGDEAVALMASMVPDIVVLDLHLPGLSGEEVLRHIRSNVKTAQVPVIIATAHPQMAENLQDDVEAVLIKPVRYATLKRKAIESVQAHAGP
jgi:excisionase family DNA binding protein